MTTREMCKSCGKENPLGFAVPDYIWKASVPPEFRRRVLCIMCFAKYADAVLVDWDREIEFFPVSLITLLHPVPS